MNIEMKPLTVEDVSEYAEVIRQSFSTVARSLGFTHDNCPIHTSFITDTQLKDRYKEGYYPYGCFIENKIIGFVSLTDTGNNEYALDHLAILPEYRHSGYGKSLLDFCKSRVREIGGNKIAFAIIEENCVLKDWYAANGFIHTGTKKFEHLPFTVGYMELDI